MKTRRTHLSIVIAVCLTLAACGDASSDGRSITERIDGAQAAGPADATTQDAAIVPLDSEPVLVDSGTPSAVDAAMPPGEDGAMDVGTTPAAQRPDLSNGPADRVARVACALREADGTPMIAAADPGSAGQILLLPSDETAYDVELPDSGIGFVTLEVPDWAITIGGGLDFSQSLTILDPDGVTEQILPLSWNGVCGVEGLTDQRLKYHSWGAFVAEVRGEPGSTIRLSFVKL